MNTIKKTLAMAAFAACMAQCPQYAQAQDMAYANFTIDDNSNFEPVTLGPDAVAAPLGFAANIRTLTVGANKNKVALNFSKKFGEKLTITMYDQDGHNLFSKIIPKESTGVYKQIFDISQLEPGNYYLRMKNGSDRSTKVIEVKTESQRVVTTR